MRSVDHSPRIKAARKLVNQAITRSDGLKDISDKIRCLSLRLGNDYLIESRLNRLLVDLGASLGSVIEKLDEFNSVCTESIAAIDLLAEKPNEVKNCGYTVMCSDSDRKSVESLMRFSNPELVRMRLNDMGVHYYKKDK